MDESNKLCLYMNSLINSIPLGVLAVSTDQKVIFINGKAKEMLEIKTDIMADIEIKSIIPNLDTMLRKAQSKTGSFEESLFIDNKGHKLNLEINSIKNGDNLLGIAILIRDMKNMISLLSKYSFPEAAYTFDTIVGESPQIREIISQGKAIADSPSTVLITGESGCGKELLAQAIHNESYRSDKPFIAVNCGAIPKNLIESELFGYEDGSFTGAQKGGRPGKFELADGGTIFLDEIGEMPLEMQVILLRVLQESQITRIGGKKSIPVNVRVIAATNKNLKTEIKRGMFRAMSLS